MCLRVNHIFMYYKSLWSTKTEGSCISLSDSMKHVLVCSYELFLECLDVNLRMANDPAHDHVK